MPESDTPWEPPLAGSDAEQLTAALDRLRWTFRWKAGDLDAAGLQATLPTSSLTLGGLLKHLAAMEDYTFTVKMRGEPIGARGMTRNGMRTTTGNSPRPLETHRTSCTHCGMQQ